MPISYKEAREILAGLAATKRPKATETVSLHDALNRVVASDYDSPISTPKYDTSAMDGFAVASDKTSDATPANTLSFHVRGTMAAGDLPFPICDEGLNCVEIMTGARFPAGLDAVIPVEHATCVNGVLKIAKPVMSNHHRRFAGSDFPKGVKIISEGSLIKPRHIIALASVGITELEVRKIRVGIWSTGLEIVNGMTPDVNGPYLDAALRELGMETCFLGVIPDDANALVQAVKNVKLDLLLTTGAVSAGKFDFVRESLELMSAQIHFHHVAMRPGHPALCASIGNTVFFGLPGNPIATAACFRFLVVPFLVGAEEPARAKLMHPVSVHLDVFRHGIISNGTVEINQQQSPAKSRPFSLSTCWVHLAGTYEAGDMVDCYPI